MYPQTRDIGAIMRAIPDITVLVPADGHETRKMTPMELPAPAKSRKAKSE